MSVDIEPSELGFRRPFTVEVGQLLTIKNHNTSPVAFKVKTTAPKQYCVRPNSGRIEPGHEVEVTVLLQAMKTEPPLDAKCRDKFLVQSIAITGDKEFTNVQQLWDTVDKSAVQERKIRVNWHSGEGQHAQGVAATPARHSLSNGVEATPEHAPPPAYSSPSEELHSGTTPGAGARSAGSEQGATGALASTVAAVQPAVEATYAELKEQLAKAQATITKLTNDASAGLRQRKAGATGSGDSTVGQTTAELAQAVRRGTEGVPIQLVAALCLVSFLLAYFFF